MRAPPAYLLLKASMNAYLEAMKSAAIAGFYIPEIEVVYFRYDNFQTPRALALDFGI